jgi:pyruvate/2-oxoglutarate dehydrogenase complex dihydrolipoamide dehydrogenase (E3) component
MEEISTDYTLFFNQLETLKEDTNIPEHFKKCFYQNINLNQETLLIEFVENYKQRLSNNQISREESRKLMQKANPKFVLRNYLLYDCIAEMEEGKTELFDKLWNALQNPYEEIFDAEKIDMIFNADTIKAYKNDDNTITVTTTKDGDNVTGTHLLLAIGRVPNTDLLGLENTSIEKNNRGFINVNEYCQTNVEGIYAMGDCNGKGAFTHTSYNDYQIVENQLFGEKNRKISDRITTYGLFIDPPLGRVGMTKTEAISNGHKILVAHRPMDKVGRAKEKGETFGFMEAIINAENNQFLGACVFGVGGDELINGITNLMYAKQPYTVFRDGVHIHPTVSELIPTMLEKLKPLN